MSGYYGDRPLNSVIRLDWDSFDGSGASVDPTGYATTDIKIFKDSGTTERNTDSGITVSAGFDSRAGLQIVDIDTGNNGHNGFYAAGSHYRVACDGVDVDGNTVRFWVGSFDLVAPNGILSVVQALSTAIAALAAIFTGITSLAQWLGAMAGKQAANTTARNEIRATGAGSGTYDEATDSQEATRDNMGTAQTGDVYALANGASGFVATRAVVDSNATGIAALVARLGAWTGTGVNTVLGAFKALLSKIASTPSDIGGTFDPAADSTEAVSEAIVLVKAKTDLIPASPAAVGSAMTLSSAANEAVADALIARRISGGANTGRTVGQALAVLRNKVVIAGGVGTVYDTDDSTPLWTFNVVQTAGDPISAIDPTS
jgi:hypothetical protein